MLKTRRIVVPLIVPVVLCALLALACGGDDDGEEPTPASTPPAASTRAPEASATAVTETTAAGPTAGPAATAERPVDGAGPVEPLALVPDDLRSPLVPELVVYDVVRQSEIIMESEAFFQAWLTVTPPFTQAEDGHVRLFDEASRRWMRLDLGDDVEHLVASDDGGRVALTVDGMTYLVELAGKRTQQEISTSGRPIVFSPDGGRLLLRMPEQAGVSPYVVVPVGDPAAAVRLPLGGAENEISQHSPQWLDEERLMLISEKSYLLQVYDVSRSPPGVVLEQVVESDQVVLSPDGRRVAVGQREANAAGSVVVYEVEPFAEIARFENATLGQQLEVPLAIWTADGSRLLMAADECLETERLVAKEVDGQGEMTVMPAVPLYRFVFSPDGEWVAFTAHARNGYVAPADGSSPPTLVGDDVNAAATPLWSPDSSFVAFQRFSGGYDQCLGFSPRSP